MIRTGGFSSYPSVVFEDASYESLIETVFHEWLHSYLIFFPLGTAYFGSSEARTLNESVANIAGAELARLYLERHGTLDEECGASPCYTGADATAHSARIRFHQRDARPSTGGRGDAGGGAGRGGGSADGGKAGRVRGEGIFIRELNQAYFAFHGFYADTAASIDPIGPKLQTLLERAGSPGEFVRVAAGVTSRAELDAALE